jgi:hypothetical protein
MLSAAGEMADARWQILLLASRGAVSRPCRQNVALRAYETGKGIGHGALIGLRRAPEAILPDEKNVHVNARVTRRRFCSTSPQGA